MTPEERTALLLRERLAGATADISAAPGVAERAAIGGRRRLKRRRITEGAVTAVAAAAAVLAVLVPIHLGTSDRSQPAGRPDQTPAVKTDGPTGDVDPYLWLYQRDARGDLKGDKEYVNAVLRLWSQQTEAPAIAMLKGETTNAGTGVYDAKRGTPKVVWAGKTDAGNAALVVEPVTYPDRAPGSGSYPTPGKGTLAGFIGVDEKGRPRIVDDAFWAAGQGNPDTQTLAWFVDRYRTTVVALDLGTPIGWAQGWRYGDDGVRDHDWKPLEFRDGAASFTVGGDEWYTAAVASQPYTQSRGQVRIAGSFDDWPQSRALRWGDINSPAEMFIKGMAAGGFAVSPAQTFSQALNSRIKGSAVSTSEPTWTASGALPDGTSVVVSDTAIDGEISHAYAVLTSEDGRTTRVVHGGQVDEYAALPVIVKLPDGAGTVVARPTARLEYRVSSSTWQFVGFGAGLIPSDATAVRVTPDNEESQVVNLRR